MSAHPVRLRRRLAVRALAAGLAAAALLACASCGDEDACGPEVPAGRLLGHVRTGGLPITATVSAYRVSDGVRATTPLRAVTDTTGYYAMDLPAGRYVVTVLAPDCQPRRELGGTSSGQVSDIPDTFLVDGSRFATTLDFQLAGLALDLLLSRALDRETGTVVLHRRDAPDGEEPGGYLTASEEIVDGHLRLRAAGIPPGDYQVEVVLGARQYACFCPYDGEHLWWPGTRERAQSPWTTFAPDGRATLAAQVSAEPAWLSGRVGGAAAALGLLSGIDLIVVAPDSTIVVGRRRLGDDGLFAVPLHLAGPVKVGVVQSGATLWAGGADFAAATVFDLVPGQSVSDLEIAPAGLVVDVEGPGADLAGAAFEFYAADGGALVTTAALRLGTQRRFGLANLPPGRYRLHVRHEHGYIDDMWSSGGQSPLWRPQWYDRATGPGDATVIELAAGQVTPLHLVLEAGGTISGHVAIGDGASAVSCYVFVTPAERRETLDQLGAYASQGQPSFAITGLADGLYKIGACPSGEVDAPFGPPPAATVWYPGTGDWETAGTIAITGAGTVADLGLSWP